MSSHRLFACLFTCLSLTFSALPASAAAQSQDQLAVISLKPADKEAFRLAAKSSAPREKSADKAGKADKDCKNCTDRTIDGHLLMGLGYSHYGLSGLNTAMQAKGYSPFSEHSFAIGGNLELIFSHFITEFETNFAFTTPSLNADFISSLSEGNFLLNFGYEFKPIPRLRIYPLVGIGIGFLDLDFKRRARLPSFDEFLSNPGRQGHISDVFFTLNAALGLDWATDFCLIGVRGGYLWTPASNWWQLQEATNGGNDDSTRSIPVAGGPDISLSGPYVKVMLGF